MSNKSKIREIAAAEVKRWSAGRKKDVVLRLLHGEPAMSRSLLNEAE